MVWDPPKQQVNVRRMIIYSFIPILSIYAGWRIQKFWLLFIINFILGVSVGFLTRPLQEASPPYAGVLVGLAVQIPVSIFLVRKFAMEYNEKITRETTFDSSSGGNSPPSP